MFALVGFPVAKLKRVSIGPLADPNLEAGMWRDLTPEEVEMLRHGPRRRPKAQPPKLRRSGRPGRKK
jgi:16S rRNA U516 pseudouridylate synthase RsuA-like enzyme